MAIPYCTYHPTGEFVEQVEGGFDTHLGRIGLPPGQSEIKFIDSFAGPNQFKFGGLGQESGYWEWIQHVGWRQVLTQTGRMCYDWNGHLRDALPAGIQFIDDNGEPFPRLIAYNVDNGLNEWTRTGGLQFGQTNARGGVAFWDGTSLRFLDEGECYDVKVKRSGDLFAIAWWKSRVGSRRSLMTRQGLLAIQPDIDPPVEVPPVEKNMLDKVTEVRSKYPTPLGAEHGKFLVEVAQATGKGLLRKTSGTRVNTVFGEVAQDILTDPAGAMHYDILRDGEGAAEPTWGEVGPYDPSRYVQVNAVPVPVPVPDTPDEDDPDIPIPDDVFDLILIELRKLNAHLGVK